MSDKISRFAIIKGEHCCFGHYNDDNDPECETCEATHDCEENTK